MSAVASSPRPSASASSATSRLDRRAELVRGPARRRCRRRVGRRAHGACRRAGRPACRRSPTGRRWPPDGPPRPRRLVDELDAPPAPGRTAPSAAGATDADRRTAADRPAGARRSRPPTAASRSARSAVGSWWTVAPSSSSSRTPGPGRVDRRAGQHEMDVEAGARPGGGREPAVVRPAPAGRHERVGTVGERGADEELEVAQLVAAERDRQQVLALDPDVGAIAEAPPTAAARAAAARAHRTGGSAGDRPSPSMVRPVSSADRRPRQGVVRHMATRITPADRHTTVGQHAGMERSIAISRPTVGSEPALLIRRVDGARGQDPDPPPRRLRDVDLHPVRVRPLHVGTRPAWSTR